MTTVSIQFGRCLADAARPAGVFRDAITRTARYALCVAIPRVGRNAKRSVIVFGCGTNGHENGVRKGGKVWNAACELSVIVRSV